MCFSLYSIIFSQEKVYCITKESSWFPISERVIPDKSTMVDEYFPRRHTWAVVGTKLYWFRVPSFESILREIEEWKITWRVIIDPTFKHSYSVIFRSISERLPCLRPVGCIDVLLYEAKTQRTSMSIQPCHNYKEMYGVQPKCLVYRKIGEGNACYLVYQQQQKQSKTKKKKTIEKIFFRF